MVEMRSKGRQGGIKGQKRAKGGKNGRNEEERGGKREE